MVHVQLEELEEYAKKNNIPIMQKDGIEYLVKYIKDNNIKSILEIGSAIGYSAIKMALVNESVNVITIERDIEKYKIALNNIKKFNLQNRITIINDDALNVSLVSKYDLIFIDAAKSQYINFFNKFDNNLKANGVIITDNLSFHGMVEDSSKIKSRNTRQLVEKIKKYISFLKDNYNYSTTFLSIGDGISISIKK